MTTSFRKSLLLLGALLSGALQAAPQADCPPQTLRIAFSDRPTPPFLRGEGDRFPVADPGLLVVETGRVIERLGCPAALLRLPQRRLLRELERGEIDFAVGFVDLPERLRVWQFPLNRRGEADRHLALALSPVQWAVLRQRQPEMEMAWRAGRLKGRLGTLPMSGPERLVLASGLRPQPVENPARVVELLRLERFDAIALPRGAFDERFAQANPDIVWLQPPLGDLAYYAPASRRLYAQSPAFVMRFWQALCEEARKRPLAPGCPL